MSYKQAVILRLFLTLIFSIYTQKNHREYIRASTKLPNYPNLLLKLVIDVLSQSRVKR